MTTKELDYLDHGFIRLVDFMGSDRDIVAAAKLSYASNKDKTINGDEADKITSDEIRLLRYLLRHRHTSPFEMAEVKFHIKLPIFVMRQLVRHRTANLNELSGRYSELPSEFYVPDPEYLAPQSKTNKQGRSGELSEDAKEDIIDDMKYYYTHVYQGYKGFLREGDSTGLSRELARIILPVGIYTECFWKIDLNNLFKFLSLRQDPHAQKEIVDLADGIYNLTKTIFPESISAYDDYIRNSLTFSAKEIMILREFLTGMEWNLAYFFEEANKKNPFASNELFTKREFEEFLEKLKRLYNNQ